MDFELLNKAARQGIISDQQAQALHAFILSEQKGSPKTEVTHSGESLKFMRSFGDVFIALGVLLLTYTSNELAATTTHIGFAILGFVLISEWLVGHKRLVLPGITLLLSILFFLNSIADSVTGPDSSLDVLAMSVASLLFYLRYKMPFSLYPVAVGSIYLVIKITGINVIEHPYLFIILGIAVFLVAMWYDSHDTQRVTSLSDNGFWLHLLAAPLIVHGVMVSLFLSPSGTAQINSLYILLLFTLFFFVALFVDRRAILVSSFAYALYAVFKFAYQQFMQVDNLTLFIFMGIGLFVIFFGTYWYTVRAWIFSPISSLKMSQWVPEFKKK